MTADNIYLGPRTANSGALLFLVLAFAAMRTLRPPVPVFVPAPVSSTAGPVLQVEATPRQGFGPMKLQVQVHQHAADVAGREVCVRAFDATGEQAAQSCWQDDNPVALVLRTFELSTPGEYEVQAVVRLAQGLQQSNRVLVRVVSNGH